MQCLSGVTRSRGVRACLLATLFLCHSYGQTRIDLSRQSRQADFRLQENTAPFVTGTSIPAVCNTGEVYFKTDAPAGHNLFLCVAPNTWSGTEASGSIDPVTTTPSQLVVTRISDAQLVVTGCSAQQPCNYAFNGEVSQITETIQVNLNGGSGTLLGYLDRFAGYVVATSGNLSVSCTGCTVVPGGNVFPWDAIPQFRWAAAAGKWEPAGFDLRALAQREIIVGGDNINVVRDGDAVVISTSASGVTSTSTATAAGGITVFAGTDGKQIRQATGSGFVKAADGVLETVSQLSAGDIAAAAKQGNGALLATTDAVTPGHCAEWDANGKLVSANAPCGTGGGSGTVFTTEGIAPGSKQGTGSLFATAGTVTPSRCAEWDANGTLVSSSAACNAVADGSLTASKIAVNSKQGSGTVLATAAAVTPSRCAEWDANGTLVSSSAACNAVADGALTTSKISAASRQGTGTVLATATAVTPGRCAEWDANGTLVSSSIACGAVADGTVTTTKISAGSKQGAGTLLATTSGTVTPGRCAEWDANGTLVSSSGSCNGGGGIASGANTSISTLDRLRTTTSVYPIFGTLNQVRAILVTIPHSFTAAKAAVNITAAGAGARCYIGIYDQDGTKQSQSDLIDASATGIKLATFSTQPVLSSGSYYVAWSCDNTSVRLAGASGDTNAAGLLNANSATFVSLGVSSALTSSGVMPGSLGTVAASAIDTPQVILFNR